MSGLAKAESLNLPPRPSAALSGSAFAQKIASLEFADREREIFSQLASGNLPPFLRTFCPVTVTNVAAGKTNVATYFVAPDYLAIGSDTDYFLIPMSPATCQRLADLAGCVLPTRKMVDDIYAAAAVKLVPAPIPPSVAMTTVPIFARHSETVRAQRLAALRAHPLGALVAGHQKDVVISPRLGSLTNRVAIYGWHQTNGTPIQPLYLGHTSSWVDYSQCVRWVGGEMIVNGRTQSVAAVLADPALCGLISDEGIITNARYPTQVVSPATGSKLELPWPNQFAATPWFGERVRDIELREGVRIVMNAPPPDVVAPDKPVLLVFYALPNGATIEQAVGKAPKSGDDWRFDIQHIGAQTRWLRAAMTNRTLVVAYFEAAPHSWPLWRKSHDDQSITRLFDSVRAVFAGRKLEVALTSHSGGGSLVFGYLNAVEQIPSDVVRIAFLDSNYAYDSEKHAAKLKTWLAASEDRRLCVLAYDDASALLNGRTFVSAPGGTWGRSRAMLGDLGAQFEFTSQTNHGLETYAALGGRIEFLLAENPEAKILHTFQVERNGFIEALLSGTAIEAKGYEYFGQRAYDRWITPSPELDR